MKKRKKNILSKEEKAIIRKMPERMDYAISQIGMKSRKEMNAQIKKNRGDCPDESMYRKMDNPPNADTESFYNVSINYLWAISEVLDVTIGYLIGKEPYRRCSDVHAQDIVNRSMEKTELDCIEIQE